MSAHPSARAAGQRSTRLLLKVRKQSELYRQAMRSGTAVNVKEFTVDLRAQLCILWREVNDAEPKEHRIKRATYHWFLLPYCFISREP